MNSSLLLKRQHKQQQQLQKQQLQNQQQKQQKQFVIFDDNSLALERKKKYKDRRAGIYVDVRKLYPPFKVDKDLFFLCDYPNPEDEDNEPCNLFFGAKKSIYAHYSRVHNKQNNPNKQRKLRVQYTLFDRIKITPVKWKNWSRRIIKKTYNTIPTLKQNTLLEFQ